MCLEGIPTPTRCRILTAHSEGLVEHPGLLEWERLYMG
jgi:hypothetical protein